MKLFVISDLHIDAGQNVYGESRVADAEKILEAACTSEEAKAADVLLFLGDLARTASPEPPAYRVAQKAFGHFSDRPSFFLLGNHDHLAGSAERNLDVVAAAVGATVIDKPKVVQLDEVGLAFVPWVPPINLFGKSGGSAQSMHVEVAERLHQVARGLQAQLDASKPRILCTHWLIAGEKLASGQSVITANEPLLDAGELEAVGWDLVLAGHNHIHQQISPKVWSVGPPMRGGFGEANVPVGYMTVTLGGGPTTVTHHPSADRALLTFDLDPARSIAAESAQLTDLQATVDPSMAAIAGAIVRIRYVCRPDQQQQMAHLTAVLGQALLEKGAHRVLAPQVTVDRVRKARERLEVDVDPQAALSRYLEVQGIDGALALATKREAASIVGESVPEPEPLSAVADDDEEPF
jgi:DNA repair exonuclease SbcCD nuclease subunit